MGQSVQVPAPDGTVKKRLVEVFFDRSSGQFYAMMPAHLAPSNSASGTTNKSGLTVWSKNDHRVQDAHPNGVIKQVEAMCKAFTESLKTERKVIVYELSYFTKKKSQNWHTYRSFDGVGVAVTWSIAYETKIGSEVEYDKNPQLQRAPGERGYLRLDEDQEVIEWTQDREDFFKAVDAAVEGVVAKMRRVMGKKKTLLELADRRGPLLLTHEDKG
jgi:hypothetical protein